jgi:saccharopine dehydrogenase-like NADP-dependent oxidoreductase
MTRAVEQVICADANIEGLKADISDLIDMTKVRTATVDAGDSESLDHLFRQADVAIDLLPRQFLETVCQAAVRAGVSVVNTNYADPIAYLNENSPDAGWPSCPNADWTRELT